MNKKELEWEILKLRDVLGSLITWIAQSSASPISMDEAKELLRQLNREQRK